MCLIAFKQNAKQTFHEKYFDIAKTNNDDGIGIMYISGGRVIAKKSDNKATDLRKKELYDEFLAAPAPSLLHLRMTTHGATDEENAHPYQILSKDDGDPVDLFLMHNGVVGKAAKIDSQYSDTWHFANLYIKPMVKKNPYLLCNPFIQEMIKEYIGSSRLVFLYSCGTHVIIEDNNSSHKDEIYGGCWLSNRYALNDSRKTYGGSGSSYSGYNTNHYGRGVGDIDSDWGDDWCGARKWSKDNDGDWKKGENGIYEREPKKDATVAKQAEQKPLPLLEKPEVKPLILPPKLETMVEEEPIEEPLIDLTGGKEEILDTVSNFDSGKIYTLCREQPEEAAEVIEAYRDYWMLTNKAFKWA